MMVKTGKTITQRSCKPLLLVGLMICMGLLLVNFSSAFEDQFNIAGGLNKSIWNNVTTGSSTSTSDGNILTMTGSSGLSYATTISNIKASGNSTTQTRFSPVTSTDNSAMIALTNLTNGTYASGLGVLRNYYSVIPGTWWVYPNGTETLSGLTMNAGTYYIAEIKQVGDMTQACLYTDGKASLMGCGSEYNLSTWDNIYIKIGVNGGSSAKYDWVNATPVFGGLINLNIPIKKSIISTENISFSSSGSNISSSNHEWKNITYYVWNETGLFNTTFINIVNNDTFNNTLVINNFVTGNYKWNVIGWYGNATFSNYTSSTNNNTFEWRPFEIVSQGYKSHVYETDYQNFNLTINTLPIVLSVSSKLNYNGTLYSGTTSCSGEVCNIHTNIDIPLVSTGESINRTAYWEIIIYDGTSSYSFTTGDQSFQQNITRIHLEKCAGAYTTQTVNFTAYYETNLTRINPFYITGTFDNWLGSGSIYRTTSFNEASTADLKLCITPTKRTQYSNVHIEYKFDNENVTFIPRNYFFQNKTLTNITEEINLFLLEAEDSTSFIIKVQDQKLSPVTEALVYIQKYYPLDGLYRTVQIAKTDSNGETIGFYETETVDYKHIIIKNGETLLETASQKVVGKSVPYTLTFTIGTSLGYPWSPFEDNLNVNTTLTFDDDTNIVTYSYIENTTDYVTSGRLLVYQNSLTNSTDLLICNVSSTESSATLTCDLGSYNGTFIAIAYINGGSEDIIQFIITDARDVFGDDGLFLGLMIILVAGFAMMWNPVAGIVSINSAVIFVNLIGIITVSPIFIFGMIAISIITMILLKT